MVMMQFAANRIKRIALCGLHGSRWLHPRLWALGREATQTWIIEAQRDWPVV